VPNFNLEKPLCLLIRGKPSSGKTTTARALVKYLDNCKILDPDEIDLESRTYKHFSPRKTKNPTDNVKMYCYLYNKAETVLKNGGVVIWTQPWSRAAEIDLTVRNLGYYFTTLGELVWALKIEEILAKLPFALLIVEMDVDDSTIINRWLTNNPNHKAEELSRLKKTISYFQSIDQIIPYFKVSGNINNKKVKRILYFIEEKLNKQKINTQG